MTAVLTISGWGLAKELERASALLNRKYDNTPVNDALDDLLDAVPQAWSVASIDGGIANTEASFAGLSIWDSVLRMSKLHDKHVRQVPLLRQIDFGSFGDDSGVLLTSPARTRGRRLVPNPMVGFITSIKIVEEGDQIVNRIIPVGAGDGDTLFTMRWATEESPYPVKVLNGEGPGGGPAYYIEDEASISQYELGTRVVAFKDIAPLDNTPTAFELASNALYRRGARFLAEYAQPNRVYDIQATNVWPGIKMGDLVRLAYIGEAEDADGRFQWITVNAQLIVLARTRSFDADGIETTSLTVSTLQRFLTDDSTVIVGALDTLQAFKTANAISSFREFHGSRRESIQSSGDFRFTYNINYDDNISMLHSCRLHVEIVPLKSNVRTVATNDAASSGASTATSSGASTASSSGASTATTTAASNSSSSGASTASSSDASSSTTTGASNTSSSDASSSTTTGSSNSTTTAAESQTPVSILTASHIHNYLAYSQDGAGALTLARYNTYDSSGSLLTNQVSIYRNTNASLYTTASANGTVSGAPASHTHTNAHDHNMPHTHGIAHDHNMPHTHGIAHTHTIAHTHDMPHMHDISHTHTIAHTHVIAGHNHTLQYGIYENTVPSTPKIHVLINGSDRTLVYGGPFNADIDDLEIVTDLTDEQGHPLRQTNTLTFFKEPATGVEEDPVDIIVEARSWVSSLTIVRVA